MSPHAPARACSYPMCPHTVPCPVHGKRPSDYGREQDPFYNSVAWKQLRLRVRKHQPACCVCLAEGHAHLSEMVEHITPRKVDPDLEREYGNLAGLCKSHANRKTAYERTGNEPKLAELVRLLRIGREQQERPWSGDNWRPLVG